MLRIDLLGLDWSESRPELDVNALAQYGAHTIEAERQSASCEKGRCPINGEWGQWSSLILHNVLYCTRLLHHCVLEVVRRRKSATIRLRSTIATTAAIRIAVCM